MVQMKEGVFLYIEKVWKLYIPHGSDESVQILSCLSLHLQLYIPHGSDERSPATGTITAINSLYIPHGSDESDNKM